MFSICIPAFNEEESIQHIYEEVKGTSLWKSTQEKEIVFCINGSTDNSESIAKQIATRDPRVKIIVIKEKGKNTAWMELVRHSNPKSRELFFIDADITLKENALSILQEELKKGKVKIAGAHVQPDITHIKSNDYHRRSIAETFSQNPLQENGLAGACYAILKSDAKKVSMPRDERIVDDQFLIGLFNEKIKIIVEAVVYTRLPNFKDWISQQVRRKISRKLFKERYPALYRKYKATRRLENWKIRLGKRSGIGKAMAFLRLAARPLIYTQTAFKLSRNSDSWGKTASTKPKRKLVS